MGLAFEQAAGTNVIEIPIHVHLEQIGRMVGRATTRCGNRAGKAERLEIEKVDEGIDKANRIIVCDILIERGREEQHLVTQGALDMRHGDRLLVNII